MELEEKPIVRNFRSVKKIRRNRTEATLPSLQSLKDPMVPTLPKEKARNVFGIALADIKRQNEE